MMTVLRMMLIIADDLVDGGSRVFFALFHEITTFFGWWLGI